MVDHASSMIDLRSNCNLVSTLVLAVLWEHCQIKKGIQALKWVASRVMVDVMSMGTCTVFLLMRLRRYVQHKCSDCTVGRMLPFLLIGSLALIAYFLVRAQRFSHGAQGRVHRNSNSLRHQHASSEERKLESRWTNTFNFEGSQ